MKWKIVYIELTANDLEHLEAFWLGGFSNAIGFRCEIAK